MTKHLDKNNRFAVLAEENIDQDDQNFILDEDAIVEKETIKEEESYQSNSKPRSGGFFQTLNSIAPIRASVFTYVISSLISVVDATIPGKYTLDPTPAPTGQPSGQPSGFPTSVPSHSSFPSSQPSFQPTSIPTSFPTWNACAEFLRNFVSDCADNDLSLEETTMAVGRCYENGDMNITEFVRDDYCDPDFNLKGFFGNFTETCLNTTSVAAQNVTQLCTNDLVHLRGSDDDNEFSYVPIAIAGGILVCCCATAAAAYACSKSKEVVPEGKI